MKKQEKRGRKKKDRHRFVVAEARMIDSYCNYSVIAVPVTIIESLLNSGDIENAKILNNFNKLFKAEFVADGTINAESMKKMAKHQKMIFLLHLVWNLELSTLISS